MKTCINEEIYCNRDKLAILKPLQHFTIYMGQLQSVSIVNDVIFILDSEGVLSVIKAYYRKHPQAAVKKAVKGK